MNRTYPTTWPLGGACGVADKGQGHSKLNVYWLRIFFSCCYPNRSPNAGYSGQTRPTHCPLLSVRACVCWGGEQALTRGDPLTAISNEWAPQPPPRTAPPCSAWCCGSVAAVWPLPLCTLGTRPWLQTSFTFPCASRLRPTFRLVVVCCSEVTSPVPLPPIACPPVRGTHGTGPCKRVDKHKHIYHAYPITRARQSTDLYRGICRGERPEQDVTGRTASDPRKDRSYY
jgi:hypothetical protein